MEPSLTFSTVSCTIAVALKYVGQDLGNLLSWVPKACGLGFQVIVVQDSFGSDSQELTLEIVQDFKRLGVHFIRGKYGNPGSARNVALENSNRDWIVFWDSDDIGYPAQLLSELTSANTQGAEILICSYATFCEPLEEITKVHSIGKESDLGKELLLRPGIWRIVFKISVIHRYRFPDSRMGEDTCFIAKLGIFDLKISLSETVIYTYFYGGSGHLSSDRNALSDIKITISNIKKDLKHHQNLSLDYSRGLIIKHLITCLKRGGIMLRTWALRNYFSSFVISPIKTAKSTLIFFKG